MLPKEILGQETRDSIAQERAMIARHVNTTEIDDIKGKILKE